jgi:type IV pilus secretin PilQ/predicted competence protein
MSANKLEGGRLEELIGFLRKLTFIFIVLSGMLAVTRPAYPADVSTAPPVNLKKIRAYVGEGFSSIVLKFDKKFLFDEPVIKENEVLIKFKNTTSLLETFRELSHIDSWFKLEKAENDLIVSIGLPKGFSELKSYRLRRGYLYAIKMYKRKEIFPNVENLQAPAPVSPDSSEKTEAFQSVVKKPDPSNEASSSSQERPVPEGSSPERPTIEDTESKSVEPSESDKTATPIKPDSKTNVLKKPDAENQLTTNGLLTLNFYQSEIQEVLSALAMEREINIATAQDVSGKISVHLHQVTLAEALDAIVLAGGFQYKKHDELYYIYKSEESGEKQAASLQMKILKLRYAEMEKVGEILKALPREGTIQTHAASKTIIVEDTPETIQKMETILSYLDQKPKQVLIEAKILQVGLTDDMAFGVDWAKVLGEAAISTGGFSRAILPTTGPVNPSPGNAVGVFTNLITAIGTNYQFSVALDALQNKTRVNTLSTPKVLAIHGKSAKVQVGGQQGYRVTTTNLGVATETIEFIDTGTILEITPYIDDDGNILLEVLPSIQDAELQLGIPVVKTTSVSTWLMAKSGETVFIGGLIKDNKTKTQNSIPCLGSIEGLGTLFGRTASSFKKEELVILITPRILNNNLQYVEIKEKEQERVSKTEEMLNKLPLPPKEQIREFIKPIQ